MSEKKLKNVLTCVSILLVCVLCGLGLYMTGLIPGRNNCDAEVICAGLPEKASAETETDAGETETQPEPVTAASCSDLLYGSAAEVPGSLSHEGYTLEKVVVISRHNIRSPLSGPDSLLGSVTPHEWFQWSSGTSELSLRGGALETNMGHYFRKWLEHEGLFPENYHPGDGEVRFYANSKQRTIATAQYFLAGLLPTANLDVEYHEDFDKMDPVFNPQLTFMSDSYEKDALAQMDELFSGPIASLGDNYELLSDVIDIEESEAMKNNTVTAFSTDDTEFVLKSGAEPGMTGSLKIATSISDALVLQYYEESDPVAAGFGTSLTTEQWKDIAEILGTYGDALFTAPLISVNVANPLLKEIEAEMNEEGRVFTFLCGHDSNVASLLSALDAEPYELPNAIEKATPIGVKLVFSKWTNAQNEVFWSVDLVHQTTRQLRALTLLDLDTHPAIIPMVLKDVERNADGLYPEKALMERFDQSIAAYDDLTVKYAE